MRLRLAFSLLVLPAALFAQTPAVTQAAAAAPLTRRVEVPEGTEFIALFTEPLSSKTASEGDAVRLKVDESVIIDGDTVIRAGSIVRGTISEAKGAGYMGKGGKLNMRIESVSLADGQHAKVRSAKSKGGDEKRGQTVALTVLFGGLGLLRRGNDAEIKAGTPLHLFTDETAAIVVR
jgi:hypothetical protein